MTSNFSKKVADNKIPKIIVLGGYGAVGKILVSRLSKQYPGAVIIAGRDGNKAKALSDRTPHTTYATIDGNKSNTYIPVLAPENNVRVVISCVELPAYSTLAQEVLARGIHFTELTATYDAHKRLLALDQIAKSHKSTAIVGVGLMPGLSNIMAYDISQRLDVVDRVEINLMLGLGDSHGLDAVKWTLRNFASRYESIKSGHIISVKSFTDAFATQLIDEKKLRHFYRFNFSDQHTLTHSIKANEIVSRMAFDSRLVTRSLGWLRRVGLLSLIKDKHAGVAHKMMHTLPLGSDQWALQVEAHGLSSKKEASHKVLARGRAEGDATAVIATYVVAKLYEDKLPHGVHAIEKYIEAEDVYRYARRNSIKITLELLDT